MAKIHASLTEYVVTEDGKQTETDVVCATDCAFIMDHKLRKESYITGKRNLHAWISGNIVTDMSLSDFMALGHLNWVRVRYTHGIDEAFVAMTGGDTVLSADLIILAMNGTGGHVMWAHDPIYK